MNKSITRGLEIIKEYVKTLGNAPGVYRMLDADATVLYVGKAKNLKRRVTSYTRFQGQSNRIQRMIAKTTSMVFVTTHTEVEALLLEANLIKKFKPSYNVLMRDDKSFAYILLRTDHPVSQLTKHRGEKTKGGEYYGPFASSSAVNETLTTLHKVFKLRSCTDAFFSSRKRPCLQYHIKRCSAPCVNFISPDEYVKSVQQARAFLRGENSGIQKRLAHEMHQASLARNYELAVTYRDRIQALTRIQAQQSIHLSSNDDMDVIAAHQAGGVTCIQIFFFRGGNNYGNYAYYPKHDQDHPLEEVLSSFLIQFYTTHDPPLEICLSHPLKDSSLLKKALKELSESPISINIPLKGIKKNLVKQALKNAEDALSRKFATHSSHQHLLQATRKVFGLSKMPRRIEVYDNSHISGSAAVGAMIVVGSEGFDKKSYRTFTIRSEDLAPGDDYGMMTEVLTRRFKGSLASKSLLPDLIVIDGGPGQLSVAKDVLHTYNIQDIPLVSIAKGSHRNAGREKFYMQNRDPFQLESNDPVLYFLQRIRDEAHRFVIKTHRNRREKTITRSSLDEIPGIGLKRKKALLQHFGSAQAVKQAGIEDLKAVEGISEALAKTIYTYYQQ